MEKIAIQYNLNLKHYYDKHGIWPGVIKIFFNSLGYKTELVTNFKKITNGWIIVRVNLDHPYNFGHGVAIVNGYVIDSIILPNNNKGIYKWNGKLRGYKKVKIEEMHKIHNFLF